MFDKFENKRVMLILSVTAVFALTGCKQDGVAVPDSTKTDLEQAGEGLYKTNIPEDKVILLVNGKEIMSSDADRLYAPYALQLQQMNNSGEVPLEQLQVLENRLKNQILNELIQQAVLKEAAEAEGVVVDPSKVDEVIEEQKTRIPVGQTLEEILSAQGATLEDMRKEIESKLAIEQLVEDKTADVTPQSAYDELIRPGTVTASHILLMTNTLPDEEAKALRKAELEKIRVDIIDGSITFSDAVEIYSEDSESKDKGGEYENIHKAQMPSEFDAAIYSQKIGEVGEIIETSAGYHVVKVSSRQSAKLFSAMSEEELNEAVVRKKNMVVSEYIKTLMEDVDIEWVDF